MSLVRMCQRINIIGFVLLNKAFGGTRRSTDCRKSSINPRTGEGASIRRLFNFLCNVSRLITSLRLIGFNKVSLQL